MTHDVAIIGGGILGLALAERISRTKSGASVVLVEKEERLATHQSGHNSGVLHAGIYYRPGSLKARLCIEGRAAMVSFAREHGISHEVCGKLIVATRDDEVLRLRALFERGRGHGLGVSWLSPEAATAIEPHVECRAAVHVPETGIIDFPAVCRTLAGLAMSRGATIRTGERVIDVHRDAGRVVLETSRGRIAAQRVVACAGLHSDRIARMDGADPDARIVPFRGEYFELVPQKRHLVRGLIYPVPDPALPFLGVHLTRTTDGGVHAGPNAVLAAAREGYRWRDVALADALETLAFPGFRRLAARHWRHGLAEAVRSLSKERFTRSLRAFVPRLVADDLVPAPAGVRAQAVTSAGRLVDDFLIADRGNVRHVLNAPSPAATASLAIAGVVSLGL